MARMPNAINQDPWQINQQGLQNQQRRQLRQEARNDELVDQITEPMRRYANTMAQGQANLQNAGLYNQHGFDTSSGRPSTRRYSPRFKSPQVGKQEFFDDFMSTVQQNGVTNPYALAAIAATGQAESGWSRVHDTWSDPSESGQPGTSGLTMSWRGERLQAAKNFARSVGDDPNAPSAQTQAAFFLQEDPQLIQRLNNAGSQEEAINIMRDAWRYADPNGGQTRARLEMANHFLPKFGGKDYSRTQLSDRQESLIPQNSSGPQKQVDENGLTYRLEPMSRTDASFLMDQLEFSDRIRVDPSLQRSPDGKLMVRIYDLPENPNMIETDDDGGNTDFDPRTGS